MKNCVLACLLLLVFSSFCISNGQQPAQTEELEVVFENRVVTLPAKTHVASFPEKEGEVVFLNEEQLKAALASTASDRRTKVIQAPRVTAINGQSTTINITQQQFFVTGIEAKRINGVIAFVPRNTPVETGLTLNQRGKVSADRKFVRTSLNFQDVRVLDGIELVPVITQITPVFEGGSQGQPIPFTQYLQVPRIETIKIEKPELTIPSGGHAAIAGPTFTEEIREEYNDSELANIPFVGRMFRNVGYSKVPMRTIIITSARVVEPTAANNSKLDLKR